MFEQNDFVEDIDHEMRNPTDKRVFAIATALGRGYSVDKIHEMTSINKWFLRKLERITQMEKLMT
jgi:carbamoyl-phosphate synthase/aspartate carbamoyltransferase